MQLIALLILGLLLIPSGLEARHSGRHVIWHLSHDQDDFYRQFGGRVFQIYCGKVVVYVKKSPDHRPGIFNCKTNSGSPNVHRVYRRKRRWRSR